MFQRMISDRLFGTVFVDNLFGVVSYAFPEVIFIVRNSCFYFIYIRSVFVWKCFWKLFIWKTWSFTWLNSWFWRTFNCWLTDATLIVTFPMFRSSFEQIEPISVCRLPILFGLYDIIWFYKTISCKIESRRGSFGNMLGMIIFWFSILDMIFLIDSMVVIEVIERIEFIDLSFGWGPYLIVVLNIFSLFGGGVGAFWVAFVPSVTNYFIYHFIIYL